MFKRLFKRKTSQCPVRPEIKKWIEGRFGWLVGEFGWERLQRRETVLPADEFFPDEYGGSIDDGRVVFERTCEYMELNPSDFELQFYTPQSKDARFNPRFVKPSTDWAGLYAERDEEPTTIWLETSQLSNPLSVVATFAHELAHAHILGEKRMAADEEDMELVTDLTTVFFGLGIFGANASFRETRSFELTSYSWEGYLTTEMWSYALALYAWSRDELEPEWTRYLSPEVKTRFRQAMAYLAVDEDVALVLREPADGIPSITGFAAEIPGLARNQDDSDLIASSTDSVASAEEAFTAGVFHSQLGEWIEAVDAFTAALQEHPDDGEILEQRAWAYLELGRVAEALADAENAVKLNPDDIEVYRARGVAYAQSEQYELAIVDLDKYLREEDFLANDGTNATRAYYFRGLAHAASGDHKQAVTDYSNAIRCYSSWSKPFEARADSYAQLGKSKEAARDRASAASRAET